MPHLSISMKLLPGVTFILQFDDNLLDNSPNRSTFLLNVINILQKENINIRINSFYKR